MTALFLEPSIEYAPNGWFFPPMWLGHVGAAYRKDHRVLRIAAVMGRLERLGLVQETVLTQGTRYSLTLLGTRYFSDGNFHGNNPLRQPFLCYSKLRVTRVAFSGAKGMPQTVTVYWKDHIVADWVRRDPALRDATVVLGPRMRAGFFSAAAWKS